MAWGGEAAHIQADLGDDQLRGGVADPTDLIQPVDRLSERGDLLVDVASSSALSALAWSMRPSILASRNR